MAIGRVLTKETDMPRPPNYNHERMERDRAKANKKAEKLAAKAAARERVSDKAEAESETKTASDD
jgi:hypothetical protein